PKWTVSIYASTSIPLSIGFREHHSARRVFAVDDALARLLLEGEGPIPGGHRGVLLHLRLARGRLAPMREREAVVGALLHLVVAVDLERMRVAKRLRLVEEVFLHRI